MFKAKDEITDATNRVLDLFRHYTRGDVATWEVIEATAGFSRGGGHWTSFAYRLKRDLRRTRGITLNAVRGVGWKLETVKEQLEDAPVRRQRRAGRQLHRSVQELRALPMSELTDYQRAGRARRVDVVESSLRQVRYGSRQSIALSKPSGGGQPRVRPI